MLLLTTSDSLHSAIPIPSSSYLLAFTHFHLLRPDLQIAVKSLLLAWTIGLGLVILMDLPVWGTTYFLTITVPSAGTLSIIKVGPPWQLSHVYDSVMLLISY
jgi:hypothetical protein